MKQQLELTIHPSRKAIARVGGALHLLVRAVPPAQTAQPERRAVALALAIDRSGGSAVYEVAGDHFACIKRPAQFNAALMTACVGLAA